MKKKLAAALAGVMVLTMGMATVFAATSPNAQYSDSSDAVGDLLSDYDAEPEAVGYIVSATVTATDDETYSIAVDEEDAETLGLVDGETYYIYVNGVAVEATYSAEDGAFIISASDVELEDGEDYAVDVYTSVESTDEEPSEEGSEEEPSEDDSEDDTTTDDDSEDTSSAASSEDDSTSSTGSDDTSSTSGTSSTGSSTSSPKTGSAAALPVLAVAALAGVVVCGKKVKFYE